MINIEPNVTLSLSALQALIGLLPAVFKVWIPSETDLSKELDLKNQVLRENISKKLHELFHVSIGLPINQLRGAPPAPDYIGDFVAELFRVSDVLRKMEVIHCQIREAFTYLIYTAISALLFVAIAYISPSFAVYVAALSIVVIIMQIYWVVMIRKNHEKLEEYKKTT